MSFSPKDWREIFTDKITYIISNSPITSVNVGSVINTICEATSLEDAEQYFQMSEIIRNYSLNTTSGDDLDNRAIEYGIEREEAKYASSYVTIGDSTITKVQTTIYSGLSGPKSGDTLIYGDEKTGFATSGIIIIGRDTNNVESVAYSSITEFANYVRFNLSSSLNNDHGTDESIVYSQGGNRIVPSGTKVKVEENDISAEVTYTIQNDATLLDGESELENISIVADEAGVKSNAPSGLISTFIIKPFPTATVVNPDKLTNGSDEETDSELRDRIKLHIQGLSRGVKSAILSAIIGLEDTETNKAVVSANVIETNELGNPSLCYIDDGSGFEPTYDGQGYEVVLSGATGGEKMLQLDNYPVMKAFEVTSEEETFVMAGALDLIISVNGVPETISFASTDFDNAFQATAEEVSRQINIKSSLAETRTTDVGKKITISAKSLTNENIQVHGGSANAILGFPTIENTTLFLYKNYRTLLNKDGTTANIETGNAENYSFSNGDSILIKIDGKEGYQSVSFLSTNVGASSVVDKINEQLHGGLAVLSSSNTKVRIVSNTENSSNSKIKIGRNGTITQAINNITFKDSSLSLDFPYVDQIVGLRLKMTSGALIGNSQEIASYDPPTGNIVLNATIGGTPGLGESYVIDGMANGNIGNPSVDTNKLSFSTIEVVGNNKDYTLNRTQGQIELEEILVAGDVITAGTPYTRGQVQTNNLADFIFAGLLTLDVEIDGGVAQTISFSLGTYTAETVVDIINDTLIGGRAEISPLNSSKVIIRTNQWMEVGSSVKVYGSANVIFDFPTEISESLKPHYSYLESQNAEDDNGASEYTFSDDSSLVIIIDENLAAPYSITLSYNGEVTLGDAIVPYKTFRNSNFAPLFQTDDFFKGFFVKFTSGANSNEMGIVDSYDGATGEFILTASLTNAISVTDTFIIIPRTAKNFATFLSSTIVTGLSTKSYIEEGSNKKTIISSMVAGSNGSVQVTGGTGNGVSIMFTSDGLVGGTFKTASKSGTMIGQEIKIDDDVIGPVYGFVTNIVLSGGEYTYTIETLRSGGIAVDLSLYTVSNNSYVSPRNLLNFSTNISYGMDAYTNYSGLLQKVQWTIDGKDDDIENYPGVKAAGVQVEVKPPATNRISIIVNITTTEGISLTSIQEDIKSQIEGYINNLGVSEDVIVSEIIDRVMDVDGVYDVSIDEPSANIAVGDEEIVRVQSNNILIG